MIPPGGRRLPVWSCSQIMARDGSSSHPSLRYPDGVLRVTEHRLGGLRPHVLPRGKNQGLTFVESQEHLFSFVRLCIISKVKEVRVLI